jgi:hypothetical protein
MIFIQINTILKCGFVSIYLILTISAFAQEISSRKPENQKMQNLFTDKSNLFKPFVAIETWATYNLKENSNETSTSNRMDFLFRRFRFGGKGSPYYWLRYSFQVHMDRLGIDNYSSIKGQYSGIGIWNAYMTFKLLKKSELIYLHAGYFWAAISREFNTSGWSQGALDRSGANWFMRKFMTGKGNGIESGLSLCGLKNFDRLGISYRFGTYEPQAYNSRQFESRLYTGRILFSFGDKEFTSYKFRLPGNHWQNRSGISIGFGASTQSSGTIINSTKEFSDSLTGEIITLTSETNFNQSYTYGADILINHKGLRVDGEYFIFCRKENDIDDFVGNQGHIRAAYSFLAGQTFIEPLIGYDCYNGSGNKNLFNYIGTDYSLDFGINWYIKKERLKLSLHYIIHDSNITTKTGDYLGLAFQFRS